MDPQTVAAKTAPIAQSSNKHKQHQAGKAQAINLLLCQAILNTKLYLTRGEPWPLSAYEIPR